VRAHRIHHAVHIFIFIFLVCCMLGEAKVPSECWLTPKVLRGQILAFTVFGHVVVIRRCDMIFGEFYGK
jgi:predicted membrane chloride channel (bestrophin family)